jgi:hypothetical protein
MLERRCFPATLIFFSLYQPFVAFVGFGLFVFVVAFVRLACSSLPAQAGLWQLETQVIVTSSVVGRRCWRDLQL